jgi:hypothetical protein
MVDHAVFSDAAAISQFLTASWWNVDREAGVGAEHYYSADAEFITPAVAARGHDEIREAHASRTKDTERLSRHVLANVILAGSVGDSAVAEYVVTLYAGNGEAPLAFAGPQMVFDVKDDLVRSDGRWLLKRRNMMPIFISPASDSVFLRAAG